MSAHPTEGSDGPEAVDPVMSAVLSNRGRAATPLSPDQERLLDDWVAGRLAPADAERAASLTKQNSLAAERVLERRLLEAARQSPPVPQDLDGAGPEGEPCRQRPRRRRLVASVRPLAMDDASPARWRWPRSWRWRACRCGSRPRRAAIRCRSPW